MQSFVERKKPRIYYGYIIVIISLFILPVAMSPQGTFGLFFKPLSMEFGWTRVMTSGAMSLHLILAGLLSIIVGRLNDRFGPRVVITTFGIILGIGYLLMPQIHFIWQLYLIFGVLMPLGPSGGWVPTVSTVARWFKKRRGTMTVLVGGG